MNKVSIYAEKLAIKQKGELKYIVEKSEDCWNMEKKFKKSSVAIV